MSNDRYKRTNDAPTTRPNAPWSPLTIIKPKNIRGQEYMATQAGNYFAGNQSPAPYQSPFTEPNMYEGAGNTIPPKHSAPRMNLGPHQHERNPHYQQSSFQLSPSPSPNIFMPVTNQSPLPREYLPTQPPLPRDYMQQQQQQDFSNQPRSYVIYDEEEEYGPSTAEIIANQSQDYVDEKLAEYQMTIAQLQEEQERVQKKTFTNWINAHLSKRVPPLRIEDITTDLRDGTKLLALLEVLSGERLPVEKGRVLRRPHFLSNANTALQFLASKRIKLVNINPADLVDGRPPVVLGLIWTIILYFQIEENSRNLEYLNRACSVSSLESVGRQTSSDVKAEKWKRSARKTLLNWVSNALPRESGVEVKDFGESWRDGVAFLALIDGIKANLVNLVELKKTNNRHRLNTAFDVAESKLGIAKLLDAEDVDVPKPDEKSIMTYVAQFLHKYPEPKGSTRNYLEMKENIEELLEFLKEKTAEYGPMMMSNSFPIDFGLYSIAQLEVDTHLPVYNCFKDIPRNNYQYSEWENIHDLWHLLQEQMKYWLWSIDANLPGDFQVVGKWLSEAEKLLMDDQMPTAMNEETASYISKKLERHKLFFSDLPRIFSIFNNAKATQAHLLTNEHLVSLERRLLDVEKAAKERHILLKYLEHKCCLIAFLNLVESKLNGWTDKYDELERVEQQLEQYTNFISRNKIFQEFEKAFVDMQQVVSEYKRDGNPSNQEVNDINRFLADTESRWKSVSLELKRCQNSLEEVVSCWKTWLHLTPMLKDWLNLAERKMQANNTERMEFFQDISAMKEKFDTMSNVGKYLIASCKPHLVSQLRQEHDNMLARFNQIFENTKQYTGAGDIIKARAAHQQLLQSIFQWIKHAEQTISQNQGLETSEQIGFYVKQLEQLAHELEGQENLLKSAERNIDGLLLDRDPHEIEKIISPIKQLKESLAKIRTQIANGLKLYNQLLIQQASLESGQKEIHDWLNEAENLMSTYTFAGGKNSVKESLNKHKMFFSRTVYYRSVLDTKNNILQQLLDKSEDENLLQESQKIVVPMRKLNERFERVIETAKHWEHDFVEHINAWDAFKEKEREVIEWLMQAEYYVNEKHISSKEIIENQKKFFENIDQSAINDLVTLAQNVIKHLPMEEQVPIVKSLETLRTKWLDVLNQAPLHLLKLEFYMEETIYEQIYKEIEKEIHLEQQALNHNEDLGSLLRRNEHFCQNEQFIPRLQQVVSNLKRISDIYGQQNKPNDNTLKSAYENKRQSMDKLLEKCQELHKTLQQIPAQWNSYHEKFNEMVSWMNMVDNSIKQIIKDVNNSAEFEKEKAIFQKICQEADIKREDMKWLVKTLDSLLSYATGPQANIEQEKLEHLIARYKNLIPSIEITMGKTEIFSRCHTYRREVHEVVCLLEKVKDQTDQIPIPENLEVVKRLIEDQQYAINQLDHQRPHILSMLQRGKDLVKDVNAPEFIGSVVKNLETGWNDAYYKTSDKLKELKDVQIIWDSYVKCKNDLLLLLQNAETELRSLTPLQTNPQTINEQLNRKQGLVLKMQDAAEQMLPQLDTIKTQLVPLTLPEKGKLLEQEVCDMSKMFNNTLESISERTKYLQDYSDKWNNYKLRLADLQQWAQYVAPKLLEDVSADVLTPQERLNKVHNLQATLVERKRQLDSLNADVSELKPAKLQTAELAKLQDALSIMQSSVDLQAKSLNADVQQWEQFKADTGKLSQTIEALEEKVNKSLPKLGSVNELNALQNELKAVENQSMQELDTHRDMLHTFENAISTPQYDHLVSLHPRLLKVHKHVAHTLNKFDNLENNWKLLEHEMADIESFTKPTKAGAEMQKLEDKINQLKLQNIDINEKQAKLISLGPLIDNIAIHVTPQVNEAYKKRAQVLKNALQNALDLNRDNLHKLTGNLMLSQDVSSKILNIKEWQNQMRKQMSKVERSTPEELKSCQILVDTLLQDHNDKQVHFNLIKEQIKSINSQATNEEAKSLNDNFKCVEIEHENLAKDLQTQQRSLEKWLRLLEWKTDTENHIQYLKTQLEKPLESKDIAMELKPLQQSIANWQKETVENAELYAPHQLLDSLNLPLAPAQLVQQMSQEMQGLKVRLENINQQQAEITKHKNDFEDLEQNLQQNLQNQRLQMETVLQQPVNLDNVQQIIDDLQAIQQALAKQGDLKHKLQSKAQAIMLHDNKSFPAYQTKLSNLQQADEKLSNEIAQRIATFGLIKQNLTDYQQLVGQINEDLGQVQDSCESLVDRPATEAEISQSLEQARSALRQLRNCKALLDELERKGQQLSKLGAVVNNKDIDDLKHKWQQLNDKLVDKMHKYETELVILTQIENAKKELWPRLLDMQQTLTAGEPHSYALTKYQNELPSYRALRDIIASKAMELQNLQNGQENPHLAQLVQMADQELATLAANAKNFSDKQALMSHNEQEVRQNIKQVEQDLSKIREQLAQCDDLSGNVADIAKRIGQCQLLLNNLAACGQQTQALKSQLLELQAKFPAFNDGIAVKEQANVAKQYDNVLLYAQKIKNALQQFIEKQHNDKVHALQGQLNSHKEKLLWCQPESASDKYNLEVKMAALQEVGQSLPSCEQALQQILDYQASVNELPLKAQIKQDVDSLKPNMQQIKESYDKTYQLLTQSVGLWTDYERENEQVNNRLRTLETQFKTATNVPLDLEQLPSKIDEFTKLQAQVKDMQPEITQLIGIIEQITLQSPDIHIAQLKTHLQRRYAALDTEVAEHLDKLQALQNAVNVFDESTNMFDNWLAQSKVEYQQLARMGSPGSSTATAQQLEVIKTYVNNLKHGQILLNSAVDISDTLNANFTLDNRHNKLRQRLNELREKFDALREDACILMQQIQSVLIAKTSVVESYKQILENLNKTQAALSEPELYATLARKKQALQNYKTLLQEVSLHKQALSQLYQKAVDLCDDESEAHIKDSLDQATRLMQNIEQRIDSLAAQVAAHEAYEQVLDKAKDWLHTMQFEANDVLQEQSFDKDTAAEQLVTVQQLLAQKPAGDDIFAACEKLLQKVVEQTAAPGDEELRQSFNSLQSNWHNFITNCQDAQSKLKCYCSKWQDIEELCQQLELWMQDVGQAVKSQYFQDSAEAKKAHLHKLQDIEKDIEQHGLLVKNLLEQATELDISLNNNLRISRLVTSQQTLANTCAEAIKKYTNYAAEHASFDADYEQFQHNLQADIESLKALSNIEGEVEKLQKQQQQIMQMQQKRSQQSTEFEQLIDRGELLYGHTSAEGRDVIRQKLRDLRTSWDEYTENLTDTGNNIDMSLLQMNELSAERQQIQQRCKQLQHALAMQKELKATLHEKRAQLQNHKFIAQEIQNQNEHLDNICQKYAATLLDSELKDLSNEIKETMAVSQQLGDYLQQAVLQHNDLQEKMLAAKNWLTGEQENLAACVNSSGERVEIQQKITALKQLKENEPQGLQILTNLQAQFEKVQPQTAVSGNEQITRDLQQIKAAFEQHFQEVSSAQQMQTDFLQQWNQFEAQIEQLTQYCRDTDCVFRVNQLKSTLEEKQQQLQDYKQKYADVLQKEAQFEQLANTAQFLLKNCNAERQHALVAQLCQRYQQLKDLGKQVIAQWSNIVAQQQNYADKLQALEICLDQLENSQESVLEVLEGQKLQAYNYLEALKEAADKILIETAAPGRERIRDDLTSAQERLDKLEEQISALHKRQATQNEQMKQFKTLQEQVSNWLVQMESALNNESSDSWLNAPEVRTKLNKHKLIKQDIHAYKRVIDNLNEKAALLDDNTADVGDINKRYKSLSENSDSLVKQLEEVFEVYQQFADLQKSQKDYQKSLWDRLTDYSDCSGSHNALQSRYGQLMEFQQTLLQSKNQINSLMHFVHAHEQLLPIHAKQNMLQELENLNEDLEKFSNSLNLVKNNMEGRLSQWQQFNTQLNKILSHLREHEQHLQLYSLQSSLSEKETQLSEFKQLKQELEQLEAEFEKIKYDYSELLQMSGEQKMLQNVQQITSRFQTIKSTIKDILKKCETAKREHEQFNKKHAESLTWLTSAQETYDKSLKVYQQSGDLNDIQPQITELLAQQQPQTHLLNACNDCAERCYLLTSPEGCDLLRLQLQKLQQMFSNLFDSLNGLSRNLQDMANKIHNIQEMSTEFENWLANVQNNEIILKSTLDEKKLQLQNYRDALNDINNQQSKLNALLELSKNLPQKQEIANLADKFAQAQNRAKSHVTQYESFVQDHQQYCQAVIEAQELIDATHNTISHWGDLSLDQNSLQLNLTRLKNLQTKLKQETSHAEQVRTCGEQVIQGTCEAGKVNISCQIDATQQEWQALQNSLESTIESIENKLQQWKDYDQLKQDCFDWIRECEKKLQIVDLQATLAEKQAQLNDIKAIQGEVLAKALEIDHVVEKGFNLSKAGDYINKYQQLVSKVKDMNTKWQAYVNNHQDFENDVEEGHKWIKEIEEKIAYCADRSQALTQQEIEQKSALIQDLMLEKEVGANKILGIVNQAQIVLANTATAGHADINNKITDLKELWSSISLSIADTKAQLDEAKTQWSDFMKQTHNINKSNDWLQAAIAELTPYQTTLTEKRAQLDRAIILEEKARIEKIEIDALRAQIKNMQMLQANKDLEAYDDGFFKLQKLLEQKQHHYRDHRLYKEAYDDLLSWISRSREKFPVLKESDLDNNLSIENAGKSVQSLLNKQAQGELLVEHLVHTGEVVLASTSPQGQETIRNDIRALRENFEELFREIHKQKHLFDNILEQWRDFKDEHDRFSEWLQQIDILIKNHKLNLMPNLAEKQKQVESMQEVLARLEAGKPTLDKLNDSAANLLQSHLDSFISNKIRALNSLYQVKLNLAQDALKKVQTNYQAHELFASNLQAAQQYINNANDIFDKCSEEVHSKENLQSFLQQIQQLLANREVGQNMVTTTLNNGEKVLRTTRSDGRDVVNEEMKQLQSDWERTVKKMSTIKVKLETKLLNWSDYSDSLAHILNWLEERAAKLAEVAKNCNLSKTPVDQRNLSLLLNERKAALRQINNIVQDIVSFNAMIDSIKAKANDLQQGNKAQEVAAKYEKLAQQATQLYEAEHAKVDQYQALINAGQEFAVWLCNAKDRLNKYSEPMGNKQMLADKTQQLKILEDEVKEGQKKLDAVLLQGDLACRSADADTKEIIEKEVALLQNELDAFLEGLHKTKAGMELGIVQWSDYQQQYLEAQEWLEKTEALINSYMQLKETLAQKKTALEEFQVLLQNLFDWQKILDDLNMQAQKLLEACSDARVSNAIMQLTTKYSTLLSMAKEYMRRLEQQYQEHQQYQTIYEECQAFLERTRDKLADCLHKPAGNMRDLQAKLITVKSLRQSFESDQNKLRYLLELNERVVLSTEAKGSAKIQERTDTLKQDFEKLLGELNDARQSLSNQLTSMEEIYKSYQFLMDWLEEIEPSVNAQVEDLNELLEKRGALEKYRALQRDISAQNNLVQHIVAHLKQNPDLQEFQIGVDRYENLQSLVTDIIEKLENQVNTHEKYNQSVVDLEKCMNTLRVVIEQHADCHGDQHEVRERLHKLNNINSSFKEGERLLTLCEELGPIVMANCGKEGQDNISQALKQLNTDWSCLQTFLQDSIHNLKSCLSTWETFLKDLHEINQWISKTRKDIDTANKKDNITLQDLEDAKLILEKVQEQRDVLDALNDACEGLMEKSAASVVRDQTITAQNNYSDLLNIARELVAKMERNQIDLLAYMTAVKDVDSWVEKAQQILDDCTMKGDSNAVSQQLDQINALQTRMPEGQLLVNKALDAYSKISVSERDAPKPNATDLKKNWDTFALAVKERQGLLKEKQAQWADFSANKNKIELWVKESEQLLRDFPASNGELSDMKTMHARLNTLQKDIGLKDTELKNLCIEAENYQQEMADLEGLQLRLDKLAYNCQTLNNDLQGEIADYIDYYQHLQEAEKWMLQVSFQLMAHNSLFISNKAQAEEQIEQHNKLFDEIQKYEHKLEDLNLKGKQQANRYESVRPRVEEQLRNIHESYQSLLNTSLQIKNRLHESLAKFQEYDETLDSILNYLNDCEPIIQEHIATPIRNLETAREQLGKVIELQKNINAQKERLADAILACESATASISRPTSPLESSFQPTPEKEVLVRTKLEDLLDEVNSLSLDLADKVKEFEQQQKERDELADWIKSQQAIINDWNIRPCKLRSEAAKHELNAMNDLLNAIGDKRTKGAFDTVDFATDESGDELIDDLNNLENDLMNAIVKKQTAQNIIAEYRTSMQDLTDYYDSVIKRVDALEKGSSLNCDKKMLAISEIKADLNNEEPKKMQEVKDRAAKVNELINNLDKQQIEEQLKSLERRSIEVNKRLERKLHLLGITNNEVEATKQDIADLQTWIQGKSDELKMPVALYYDTKKIDNAHEQVKHVLKALDGKQCLTNNLEKRIQNLQSELEPNEYVQLEAALRDARGAQNGFSELLKNELERISKALKAIETFKADAEKAKMWIATKKDELNNLPSKYPLKVNDIEEQILQNRKHELDLKHFNEHSILNLQQKARNIINDFLAADKAAIEQIMEEINEDFAKLETANLKRSNSLSKLLSERQAFEAALKEMTDWLDEIETCVNSEVHDSTKTILKEQCTFYEKLLENYNEKEILLNDIVNKANQIENTLSASDASKLKNDLRKMKDRYQNTLQIIKDRLNNLLRQKQKHEEAKKRLEDFLKFLSEIQQRLRDLNKPVGPKIEDVNELLSEYDAILKLLKTNKHNMLDLQGEELPEYQHALEKQDDLIKVIENQLAHLRQLLQLREQFIGLINQIIAFIMQYSDVIIDIENSADSLEQKIKQYDAIVEKIQEHEGLLATAADKGQKIATEGTAADKNSINEQLQTLKSQLNNLRKAVMTQRQKHQSQLEHHKQYSDELNEILERLHQKECIVKARPLIDRDPCTVERELEKHRQLANEIQALLDNFKRIHDVVTAEQHLPDNVLVLLSEGRSLLCSLPAELQEREQYICDNREARLSFMKLMARFIDWQDEAELLLNRCADGVDFEQLPSIIENFKQFFDNDANIRNLVNNELQQAVNQIWPSLNTCDQMELSGEYNQTKSKLMEILAQAKTLSGELDKHLENYTSFLKAAEQASKVLAQNEYIGEPINNLAALRAHVQKLSNLINTVESRGNELNSVNQQAQDLLRHSDVKNRQQIETKIGALNAKSTTLLQELNEKRNEMEAVAKGWADFETEAVVLEKSMESLEDKLNNVDNIVRSRRHLEDTRQIFAEIQNKAKENENAHKTLDVLSQQFMPLLEKIHQPSAEKLKASLAKLHDKQKRFNDNLDENWKKLNQNLEEIESVFRAISELQDKLNELLDELKTLYVFDENIDKTEKIFENLRLVLKEQQQQSSAIISINKDKYLQAYGLVPSDLLAEFTALELLTERVANTMDAKEKEFKRSRNVRSEYLTNVDRIQQWIMQTETQLQNDGLPPTEMRDLLLSKTQEILEIYQLFNYVKQNGQIIMDNTQSPEEKLLIQTNIDQISLQLSQIRTWLDDKKLKIENCLDSWTRFLNLYHIVMTWCNEKKTFLERTIELATLQEARHKFSEYDTAVRSIKPIVKHLCDMEKEIGNIAEITGTAELKEKLQEAEDGKVAVEALLLERNSLLQEVCEEWDQCERKMRDISTWIDKTKGYINSKMDKKKPLRDQLSFYEKLLADIQVQKTKLRLSIEKLEVHFRNGLGGDPRLTQHVDELLKVLDDLDVIAKTKTSEVEKVVQQIDSYQLQMQELRQRILQEEQKLRFVMTPSYLAQNREQAIAEQQACESQIKSLRSQFKIVSDKTKSLINQGSLDDMI